MTDDVWKRDEIDSPCIKICVIHPASRLCTGCLRTIDEIGSWSSMSAADKHAVLARIAGQTPDASNNTDTKPTPNASDSGSHP